MMRKSVLIIEPSEIIYNGLSAIIKDTATFDILRQIDSIEKLDNTISMLKPDLVIVNPTLFFMHKHSSVNPIAEISSDIIAVALIYQYVENNVIKQYDGVIDIRDTAEKISKTILSSIKADKNEALQETSELSDREKDVLVLIAKGMMSKEIADNLNISVHTVISHRKNITRKTGIKSIAGLVAYALLNNLIDSSEL